MYRKNRSVDEVIESIALLRSLESFNRFDVFPFLVGYSTCIGLISSEFLNVIDLTRVSFLSFNIKQAGLILFAVSLFSHIILYMLSQGSSSIHARISYAQEENVDKSDCVLVLPTSNFSKSTIVPLLSRKDADGKLDYYFVHHKTVYEYNKSEKFFSRREYPTNGLIIDFKSTKGHSLKTAIESSRIWGKNELDFPIPDFLELLWEQLVSPFFVFQTVCLILWSLDDYWYYSFFTFMMLLLFEGMMCKQRQTSLLNLIEMRKPSFEVLGYRGSWKMIQSSEIVPGDIISLDPRSKTKETSGKSIIDIPCDLLLLNGNCITNEAMLTGESTPQMKESIVFETNETNLNLGDLTAVDDLYKKYLLFSGTTIISCHHVDKYDDNQLKTNPYLNNIKSGCIGVVLQTGFGTVQGGLIKKILFAKESISAINFETFYLIVCLVVFALLASVYVLYMGIMEEDKNKFRLVLHCIMIVTSVVPPELPMELSLAITTSLASLSKSMIFCTEPHRIPFAGKIDVFCFDKTGTLTKDKINFMGLVNPAEASLSEFSQSTNCINSSSIVSVDKCQNIIRAHLACCHAVFLSDGELIGDSMEVDTFLSSGFLFKAASNRDILVDEHTMIQITKRYPFSSVLRRMSVIANVTHTPDHEHAKLTTSSFVFTKGAPETIANMLQSIPSFYWETFDEYSRRGFRILAICGKLIENNDLTRASVESNLLFLGFLLYSTDLKPDSRSVIRELKQTSAKLTMITGDGILIAVDIAKRAGYMNKADNSLLLCKIKSNEGHKFVWRQLAVSITDNESHPDDIEFTGSTLPSLSQSYCLCVAGDVLNALNSTGDDLVAQVSMYTTVFARMNPAQKTLIIRSFVKSNLNVLMCGDGTNDVGALREAHVGVSVINDARLESHLGNIKSAKDGKLGGKSDRLNRAIAELHLQESDPTVMKLGDASLASSFTARRTSIDSVLTIIRQGRCTLVTTVQVYKILALNCIISAYVMSYMHVRGLRQGDIQMTAIGILNAGLFFFLSQTKPTESIAPKKPLSSIFSKPVLLSVLGQCLVHFLSLIIVIFICDQNRSTDSQQTSDGAFQPNIVNSSVFLLSLTMNVNNFVSNYRGHPYTQSLLENLILYRFLIGLYLCILIVLGGQVVFLNDFLQMLSFPSSQFQINLGLVLIFDCVGTLAAEVCGRMLE